MASLYQKSDRWEIQFVGLDGRRPVIRLGKVSEDEAKTICQHVEYILACLFKKTVRDAASVEWESRLLNDPARVWLYDRIASAGLFTKRAIPEAEQKPARDRLRAFVDEFIAKRQNMKPNTVLLYQQTGQNLCEYFGADRKLADVTPGAAGDFKRWLGSKAKRQRNGERCGLSKATVNRRTRCAKQFFEDAVDHEMLDKNPFRKIKSGSSINRERLFFVSRSVTQRMMDACPDAEWRAIVALARYGGIRMPSELLPLRWEDVNFDQDKLTIESPKTEHCDKPFRVIPVEVFADIKPYLEDLLEVQLANGPVKPTDHVICRYRDRNVNLRTQLFRILKRAGLEAWPKLFQNMRSSRETELIYLGHRLHEVCQWLGNSPAVANDHYLQVLESAAKAELEKDAAERAAKALQIGAANGADAGQNQLGAREDNQGQEMQKTPEKQPFSRCFQGSGDAPSRT